MDFIPTITREMFAYRLWLGGGRLQSLRTASEYIHIYIYEINTAGPVCQLIKESGERKKKIPQNVYNVMKDKGIHRM